MDNNNKNEEEQQQIVEEKIIGVNGECQYKKYVKGKLLGKGGFAKCYELTNIETKRLYAAKIIPKNTLSKNRARQKLISEIKIHRSLRQTNIVKFEHVFEDQENVYILLELCTNQTLNELIKRRKRLTELEVQCYLSQMVSGLKFLHSNRIIHRDMKLGNLFLNEKMEIKVGDFGLATKLEFEGEKKRTICGTPNYIAPEVLDGKVGHSFEVDIWSLGVIIYTLLIGKPPFETPDVKTTYAKIKKNQYSFPDHVPINENARSLISKILVQDPVRRPNLDDIMNHPFMNSSSYPKFLPISTIACPPSTSYVKQYQTELIPVPNNNNNRLNIKNIDQIAQQTQPNLNNPNHTNSNRNTNLQTNPQFTSVENFNNFGTLPNTNTNNNLNSKQFPSKAFTSTNSNINNGSQKKLSTVQQIAEISVRKFIDYSSKYGLGYMLSNGSSGVFFNDSTKIIMHPKQLFFQYFERKQLENKQERQDVMNSYTLNNYPKELNKKVTLLQHFKNYLEEENNQEFKPDPNLDDQLFDNPNTPLVYLKKWMKTRHAILFRLSNKIVQVNFTDKTEVILSSELKMLTYVNKKSERSHYPLATALESSNQEMKKRLNYTKEILAHMIHNPGGNQNAQNYQTDIKDI